MGKIIYTGIDENRERAREGLFARLTGYYGPQYDVDGLCAMGAPEECAAYINTYVESGVNLVLLGFPRPDVGQLETVEGGGGAVVGVGLGANDAPSKNLTPWIEISRYQS